MKHKNICKQGKGKVVGDKLYITGRKPIVFKEYDIPDSFPKHLLKYIVKKERKNG